MNVTGIGIKEGRTPCCGKGWRQRDSAEHEEFDGAPTDERITENNTTNADRIGNGLLEEILSADNLNKAYKRVKVIREKTTVAYIGKVKFLGYGFYSGKNVMKFRVHTKSISKMRAKVKEITARSSGIGYEMLKLKLKQLITGWVNYFKLADMKTMLGETDQWLRRRLRMYIWKQCKKVKTRYAMLRKCGLDQGTAIKFANTRKGYWHVANSHILTLAVTDNRLRKAGYTFFLDTYKSVKV